MNGTADVPNSIAESFQTIYSDLQVVEGLWVVFKALLEDNRDTIITDGEVNNTVLQLVYAQNIPLLQKSNTAVGAYTDAARSAGVAVAGTVLDIAGRQRMLSQRMSKEACFVGLQINTDANLASLSATMSSFEDSHQDIIRGVGSLDDMPELTDVCTLAKMMSVTAEWNKMQPYISEIIDNDVANRPGLLKIMEFSPRVLVTMNEAVGLYSKGLGNNVLRRDYGSDFLTRVAERSCGSGQAAHAGSEGC
jgi:hypothetical protein